MTGLDAALEDYLAVRRVLGHKLAGAEYLLRKFTAYLDQAGATTVTAGLAIAWATLPAGTSAVYQAQRLSAVRGFASWLQSTNPSAEVPPAGVLTARAARAVPYLYTGDEVTALMAAAHSLRYPLRRLTYEALVGLLATAGLRVGEAIRLDRNDVCFDPGLVRVIASKFGKSREVLLHPSAVEALRSYAERRHQLCPEPKADSFFLSATGERLVYRSALSVFHRLIRHAGLGPRSERCRPRIHDLRH
jgi:integrase/recombinase XerD